MEESERLTEFEPTKIRSRMFRVKRFLCCNGLEQHVFAFLPARFVTTPHGRRRSAKARSFAGPRRCLPTAQGFASHAALQFIGINTNVLVRFPQSTHFPLLTAIVFLVAATVLPAQPERSSAAVAPPEAPASNLQRLMSATRRCVDSALSGRPSTPVLRYSIARGAASFLVEEQLLLRAQEAGITAIATDSAADVVLAMKEIAVDYTRLPDEDSCARRAHVACTAIINGTGSTRSTLTTVADLRDTIAADDIATVEAGGYDFTRGTALQQPSRGFWKSVVEPAVVIGASVVMTILFFTVRSQ